MNLVQYMKQTTSLQSWLHQLKSAEKQLVLGLSHSAKHMAVASAFEENQSPIIYVVPTMLQASAAYEELTSWYSQEKVYLFSADDTLAAETAFVSPEYRSSRIEALQALSSEKDCVVIMPLAALRKRLLPVQMWKQMALRLQIGETIESIEQLGHQLIEMGYRAEQMVMTPGEFSIRGSIVDVYPLTKEHPVRIDLFDVEVDSIRTFDPQTQRSIEVLSHVELLPATELPLSAELLVEALPTIQKAVQKAVQQIKEEEVKERIEQQHRLFSEQLLQGERNEQNILWTEYCVEPTSILDYVSSRAHMIIDDYPRCIEKERMMEKEDATWLLSKVKQGQLLPTQQLTLSAKDVLKRSTVSQTYFSSLQKGFGRMKFDAVHSISYRAMTQFFSQMPLIKTEADRWKKQQLTVVVVVSDDKRAQKVEQLFADFHIQSIVSTNDIQKGQLNIVEGSLQTGFEFPADKWVFVNEKELFNKVTKKIVRQQHLSHAERLKSYNELSTGDYVVHVNHGIGVYKGMETLEISGIHQDYMSIHYQDGGTLFVPVTQIHLIQKYVSSDAKEPKLNKLGGTDWAKTKRKVASKIEDIADELIELYAKRDAEKGYAFSKDTPEQQQFESEFPYSETADQLRSVVEIKADMEKEKPMDRLLVGDVGYGKTEVAIRAVFKAVMDGKQAAVLVPTTILAEQHYENFERRFSGYPFKVGLLSRFKTKAEQQETIAQLRKGEVDIVIGTHRLLSQDIQFFDLGLLVVDEEQRFGVKHKERLKQLKSQVDVLTLTATPIPRTLHMSMLGVRDLSVIETPPANRYPIQTYVMEQDYLTIRDGIEREMARGGQVFYLYNRVDTIERKAEFIRQLVPGVRVGIAHGQMSEMALEDVLHDFISGAYDVLVTTTIIETGVDIPNVNTLFIEDAEKMGLSQLYQLRGRVGRMNRVAYAYLMYQPDKILSEASEKRLQAMREFTELGSGFKIAMRDLSIRGAGNLLGKQQHGFIDSVGFDLYSQMLSEAVAMKQGKPAAVREDSVELDLSIDAYIPSSYIKDERQKIEMYKRIRSLQNQEAYEEVLDDLIDRFGVLPNEVSDLVEVGMIKLLSEKAQVSQIKREQQFLRVRFKEETSKKLAGENIFKALGSTTLPAQVHLKDQELVVKMAIHQYEVDQWLLELKKFLQSCVDSVERA